MGDSASINLLDELTTTCRRVVEDLTACACIWGRGKQETVVLGREERGWGKHGGELGLRDMSEFENK